MQFKCTFIILVSLLKGQQILPGYWASDYCFNANCKWAILQLDTSWQEQDTRWNVNDVHFVLRLKQQFAGRHVAPLKTQYSNVCC